MIGEDGSGSHFLSLDEIQLAKSFIGLVVVNIDIGLAKIFEYFPGAFEVSRIHRDKSIVIATGCSDNQVAAFQMFERSRYTIHQHHLHRLPCVLESQSQTQKLAYCITIRADVGSDDNIFCCLKPCLDSP